MPFPFRYICNLLQQLDDETRQDDNNKVSAKAIIETWFRTHRSHLDAHGTDACAILSTLLPERRTDRVYFIQALKLEGIFAKALILGNSRVLELRRYKSPGLGVDLADCIEGILTRTPNPSHANNELTVEEIDETLSHIAAACRFSSPAVRALHKTSNARDQDKSLMNIYRRLSPRDAKWFTRLVLKNYQPVIMDERVVFRCYHPLLPQMMKVRDDFTKATEFLRHISQSPLNQCNIADILKPAIGTKVGRQAWFKGRSIKHCLDMGRSREMSCEQKIDGEYCQIHINLRKPHSPIQIFSKSGKDSTRDRLGLHQVIRDSLKLGDADCPLTAGCILEGELVVYSNKENKILPFHKIRKHVSRSGSFLGTNFDSQPHDYEHLMIVYYDLLMIDDKSLLGVRQSERFKRLGELITCRKGCVELVQREVISFSQPSAASKLREAFAKCIVSRNEGLVLKPDESYFDFRINPKPYTCNIKLKKEYVQGWGDVGDFAVVGASYDAAKAREYRKSNVNWTHFFIGCLENKEKARARIEKPQFVVTNIVEVSEALLSTVIHQCFPSPVPFSQNEAIVLEFRGGEIDKRPTDVFSDPLVFDMRCFSFDKEPNTNFWSMRFPAVSKIHHDRSYLDTISFSELQEIASNATTMPEVEDSQEMREWIAALERADPRGVAVDATTQQSTSSEGTSPNNNHLEEVARHSPSAGVANKTHLREQSIMSCPGTAVLAQDSPKPPKLPIGENYATKPERQKRPAPDTVRAVQKLRKLSHPTSIPSNPTAMSTSLPPSPVRTRQPLGQIDDNSQSQQAQEPMPNSSAFEIASSPTDNVHDRATPSHMTPHVTRPSPSSVEEDGSKQHMASKGCSLAGKKCAFENFSILLSPCIAKYPWVTENLLGEHGVHDFITDPQSWNQLAMPKSSASKWDASSQQMRKVRVRKICLVESRRQDATKAFYGKIEAAGLKKKNGERGWVGVYDWRLLEDISDLESGITRVEGRDPWRKHYVGIA
ncbi:uncharacterized protein GGS22DRAFT_197132 [Annulohypoxylon maeteangense]|uniref:uncharacterized protein n=1 Tax=Annulohypoxylon maeteangense TaxID=1927788 RepID=UPI002008C8C5|nr:uncharacterized protein GGS22DRAFT_197132 [Annulohypoxylon maeteangense]KAI0881057.1 hypothetical protein GGS22DRAFT_197132 [Annulohypoxylon maeteangense]